MKVTEFRIEEVPNEKARELLQRVADFPLYNYDKSSPLRKNKLFEFLCGWSETDEHYIPKDICGVVSDFIECIRISIRQYSESETKTMKQVTQHAKKQMRGIDLDQSHSDYYYCGTYITRLLIERTRLYRDQKIDQTHTNWSILQCDGGFPLKMQLYCDEYNWRLWHIITELPPFHPYYPSAFMHFELFLCDGYPLNPPLMRMVNFQYFWHSNVNPKTGMVCASVLATHWSPALNIEKVSIAVLNMLVGPKWKKEHPSTEWFNPDALREYNEDRPLFIKHAMEGALKMSLQRTHILDEPTEDMLPWLKSQEDIEQSLRDALSGFDEREKR